MKIHVYTVMDRSFSHGDLNNETKHYFTTPELRDEYFAWLKNDYLENCDVKEYEEDHFEPRFEKILNRFEAKNNDRWTYHIEKGEETLIIKETKDW